MNRYLAADIHIYQHRHNYGKVREQYQSKISFYFRDSKRWRDFHHDKFEYDDSSSYEHIYPVIYINTFFKNWRVDDLNINGRELTGHVYSRIHRNIFNFKTICNDTGIRVPGNYSYTYPEKESLLKVIGGEN